MHEIPKPHPLLRLAAYLALLALPIPFRQQRAVTPIVIEQVLDDKSRFGDDDGLSGSWGRYREDGGFSKGVVFFEGRVCEVGFGVPFEGFEGVGEGEFFEEPKDALGAGLFEPGRG